MKILAQRPTHISAVATVLLITITERQRHTERDRETERETETEIVSKLVFYTQSTGTAISGRQRHRQRQRDVWHGV